MINEIDRNTIELINRICQEIDNIEYSFDIFSGLSYLNFFKGNIFTPPFMFRSS